MEIEENVKRMKIAEQKKAQAERRARYDAQEKLRVEEEKKRAEEIKRKLEIEQLRNKNITNNSREDSGQFHHQFGAHR